MAQNKTGSAPATAIETNDVQPIPAAERHGKPWHLFTVWSSPNLEFATVFVGALAIGFGLNIWQGILAIVVGNALAGITHGILSTWGPEAGLPQMVLSRNAFGKWGNLIPSGLSTLVAGIGWFAVNTISGTFALAALWPQIGIWGALAIIILFQVGIAFIGHNLIQVWERYMSYFLAVVWLIVVYIVFTMDGAFASAAAASADFPWAGFTLTAGAAYGYTAGWTAFASDYTRYLPANTSKKALGWFAGLGNFTSTTLIMIVGAAAFNVLAQGNFWGIENPTATFTGIFHPVFAAIVLLAIVIGSVSANILNVYSGAMSFLAMGFNLGFKTRRAIMVALAGLVGGLISYLGVVNGDVAHQLDSFLLVVSYWVSPWIAVVLTERILSKGKNAGERALNPKNSWAGAAAFVIATAFSIWGFASQVLYTGPLGIAIHHIELDGGVIVDVPDLTALVGFVVASVLFVVFSKVDKKSRD
ncbi:MAG: purine-cytosine permease family protein [Micrococcales bacterium]